MTLRVESLGSREWRRLWEATGREPFGHPTYAGLGLTEGQLPIAMCWSDSGGELFLPLILRTLPQDVQHLDAADGWRDAISPYGYGGPFCVGRPDVGRFFDSLLVWMRDERVVTGFIRASLGVEVPSGRSEGCDPVHLADNVVVDLARSSDEGWRAYDHKVRKNVNKARRQDLRVEVRDVFGDVDDFVQIYHSTMNRRGALESYWLGRDYFGALRDGMAGSYWVVSVHAADGRTLSAELVLRGERSCYSFLGGTLIEALPMAANDLLKHEVIEHARAEGLDSFVLGGGYRPGDGIFRYKRSFDRDGVVSFHGVRLTASAEMYRRLTAAVAPLGSGSFFPSYRAPQGERVR